MRKALSTLAILLIANSAKAQTDSLSMKKNTHNLQEVVIKRIILSISLVLVTIVALQSCISINPNGFEMLSATQKAKVVRPTQPLENLTRSDSIYIVNDNDVREFMKDKELAVVNCYLTLCTSEYCISSDLIHSQLQASGLPFLMIAGDFYCAKNYTADYPFITIDSEYYKTKRYNRSIKCLFQALGCDDKNWWHSYFLFRRGELVSSGQTLEEALKFIEK